MSVYTRLNAEQMSSLLKFYDFGDYQDHQGISAGVENTNYFVNTHQQRLVLTVFEKLSTEELPFFLELTEHLNQQGCAVPLPFRDQQGDFIHHIEGKPAVFFERVKGTHAEASNNHIAAIARALATQHLAVANFLPTRQHSHNITWVRSHASLLADSLDAEQQQLIKTALTTLAQLPSDLPKGVIHADLFHDNALFEGDTLTGVIDWYFAGVDSFALDIAITLNDWCLENNHPNSEKISLFLQHYQQVRALSSAELTALPALQVQSSLRFWLSRLLAQQQHGRSDEHITVKDPMQMQRQLSQLLDYTSNLNYPIR